LHDYNRHFYGANKRQRWQEPFKNVVSIAGIFKDNMDDPASLKLLTGTRRKLPGHKGDTEEAVPVVSPYF